MYADKGYSISRSELIESLRTRTSGPILSRRKLLKVLSSNEVKVKEFLEHVAVYGPEDDALIITMMNKERELKIAGSIFTWSPEFKSIKTMTIKIRIKVYVN